jgi:hypothetical protein
MSWSCDGLAKEQYVNLVIIAETEHYTTGCCEMETLSQSPLPNLNTEFNMTKGSLEWIFC